MPVNFPDRTRKVRLEIAMDTLNRTLADTTQLLEEIFIVHGLSEERAKRIAENCATAEADGSHSHGLFRMRHYVSTIASGYVDVTAEPTVEDTAGAVIRVDGANGFALFAIQKAKELLMTKARKHGIAVAYIRNSHHLGALYLDIEPFLKEGLVALAVANTEALVAPPGGKMAVYGTNPMAFGAPRFGSDPIFFDQSSSTVAFGEVQVAATEGRGLPAGTGVDSVGHPTGDPQMILDDGALLPFAGHKGASVALMVEILCAALGGGSFSSEVDTRGYEGAITARTGETIVLFDPNVASGFQANAGCRVDTLVQILKAAGQTRIPGERKLLHRRKSMEAGLRIDKTLWGELLSMKNRTKEL